MLGCLLHCRLSTGRVHEVSAMIWSEFISDPNHSHASCFQMCQRFLRVSGRDSIAGCLCFRDMVQGQSLWALYTCTESVFCRLSGWPTLAAGDYAPVRSRARHQDGVGQAQNLHCDYYIICGPNPPVFGSRGEARCITCKVLIMRSCALSTCRARNALLRHS